MALRDIRYSNGQYIDSCDGCGAIQRGEKVKLVLDGTNPAWPHYVIGVITEITLTGGGPTYTITIDDDDIPELCFVTACNVTIECVTCCDLLVAEDIPGISEAIDAALEEALLTLEIPASNVTGLCEAALACFDLDDDGRIDPNFIPVVSDLEGLEEGILSILDCDEDGKIDHKWLPGLDTYPGLCDAVFGCLDINDDGIIEVSLLPPLATYPNFCDDVRGCLDINGDGYIDESLLPPGVGTTPGDVIIDPVFCPAVLGCLEGESIGFLGNGVQAIPFGFGDELTFFSSDDSVEIDVSAAGLDLSVPWDLAFCKLEENYPTLDCAGLPVLP